jgi:endoglucanase
MIKALMKIILFDLLLVISITSIFTPQMTFASTPSSITLFDDALGSGVQNWSWGSTITLTNSNPVSGGSKSVKFLPKSYGAFYVHSTNTIDTQVYGKLNVNIYAVDSRQRFKIQFYGTDGKTLSSYSLSAPNVNSWKKYQISISDTGAKGAKLSGIAIQENAGIDSVKSYIDDVKFQNTSSTITPTPTPTPSPTPTPTPSPTPAPSPSTSGYTVLKGTVYKATTPIKLKGVNWFGFEETNLAVHGLWARNYKEMISQMKTLGFNAVRIPFCPATLKGGSTSSISYSLNPDLSGLNSLQVLDKVMGELNNQQMYILLDHHRPDCQAISELWTTSNYSESQWISDLTNVANRYKSLPYFMGIDLKNEPHGKATWGTGASTDWNTAAERAGKAVLAANPNILVYVEGIQENSNCSDKYGHWQGGNLNPVNCTPISTGSIPSTKLVLSPHVYGPDVYVQSYFGDSSFPSNMPNIWNQHFGSLTQKGYTIVPDEWGGKYGLGGGLANDKTWQDAMKNYFISNKICNTFYWSWNPNSGDTGGILQDDWKTPQQAKVDMLKDFYSRCSTS